MTDILVRGVAEADIRAIDAAAARAGLSRNQLLQQVLHNLGRAGAPPTVMDFAWLAEVAADVQSSDFEERAWS